ncbi:BTAD domain-containing putative transcriptional regulator [Streptomyces ipomoeae]|uniref:AfsR/SARP family transcriptional regulator n=1 Tax=Streptomyces ipomoeae TaxID=103232 RepID=UPI0029AFC587|nr:BTAD domain-containing putative transcriptional regulator [Streptomyces ipomoeae]MDX2698526.1 BTAD domain-containing putative transcriptional regulator [Streptomyces ipomoeae]MDX2825847.1 BTAD domain-containing putative transcriptional regulator [Streptomyces ipomoeae]MDX2844220.1 BTAD domain-containing putative transcriptional regulator [Streptomyces ipomoeae]MDX2878520.1 BTAD domain-containing putative transcriptional regulator [Streptomyces ipomoeae]
MRDGLRFGLLGPPVLYDAEGADAGVRPVGSGKVRALFVALLLEPGRIVSVDALKDVLWDAAPPPSAQASLQNHVTRLRRLLDDPERLRAIPPGYLLRVGEGELDVRVFESHVAAARAAHAERDWARTVREATAALALWRGTPLGGLPVADFGAQAFVQRLEEARLLLLEWRCDAELHLAQGFEATDALAALAPELAALVAEHPLREAFHRLLMLALHRTGRQAEALAVHRDLRARLLDELGVEPGPAVREAHLEVLREQGPQEAEPSATAAAEEPPRPAQLPPPPAHFTGREEVLVQLRQVLDMAAPPKGARGGIESSATAARARTTTTHPHPPNHISPRAMGRPTAPKGTRTVTVISGMAGVGKSALALHLAHELADRFPDGQLYVNLHGATPGMTPLTPAQALASLLRDLGTDPRRIPEQPDEAAALLRSTLAPTRTLMVLDDAANAAQVRPLLPAGAGCAVIVTSRSPLAALDGAHRFPLAPLSDDESAALLRAASGRAAGLDATHPLVALTGRLPLALRVVAARLAARRALTPDALAGQLAATEGRLHHLEYDDLSVRRSLAVAHEALRASDRTVDRDAAHTLRLIGALDLPAYGAPLLARLSGTDELRTEAALDRLVDVALLEETTYGRYVPHDLVRHFARELADTNGSAEAAEAVGAVGATGAVGVSRAVEQALRWYVARARQSLLVLLPPGYERDERLRTTATEAGITTAAAVTAATAMTTATATAPDPEEARSAEPPFASAEEAFAWGDRELPNIVALVERCAREHGDPSGGGTAAYVPVLVRYLFPYLHRGGRLAELDVLGRLALDVARSSGDDEAEAFALTDRAGLHFMSGRAAEALDLNEQGLTLWRKLGVVSCVRRCLNNRGLVLESLGRYAESEETLRQSLELSRQLGDPYGEAVTFSHLGNLAKHTDARAAIAHHERSLALGEVADSVVVRHTAHCNIGYAHLRLGEPAAAVSSFEQSLRVLGDDEDWQGESQTRLGLVRALRELERTDRADRECAHLLDLAERRADQYVAGLARHQRGLLLRARGRTEEAHREWRRALTALDGTASTVTGELRALLAGDA